MTILSNDLKLGVIEVNVKDIKTQKHFYQEVVGMDVLKEDKTSVTLGFNKNPLIKLSHANHLEKAELNHAGLYHFAILFESRGDLSRTIYKIAKHSPHLFTGTADHLVSEAFYFNDPEGNGIELYFDRNSKLWERVNGQIKMASIFIEPNEYLQKYIVLEEKNKEIKMGHFHLKVGSIKKAKQFYVNTLGFDITAELPGALFVSVGGYHHHFGLNTWQSHNAPKRNESLGLASLEIILPNKKDLNGLKNRLGKEKIQFIEEVDLVKVNDPWGNLIVFK